MVACICIGQHLQGQVFDPRPDNENSITGLLPIAVKVTDSSDYQKENQNSAASISI